MVVIVPPMQTEKVVREAVAVGISRFWMQQGAESDDVIRFCHKIGIAAIHGECIMIYAGQAGFHRFHRWLWKVVGKALQISCASP